MNPFGAIAHITSLRELLVQFTKRNIKARYQGTMLGLVWTMVTPLLLLAVYTFVFSVVFKAKWGGYVGESKTAFALLMLCGMTVYSVFSEGINSSVSVITRNPNYVKKVVFPLEILPFSAVLSALFFGSIWFIILLVSIGLLLNQVCLTAICLPIILVPLVMLSLGFSWFVASMSVYFRDMSQIVEVILRVLFYMTPIFYSLEMIPEKYRFVLMLNPLTIIVETVRRVLIFNQWPDWWLLLMLTLISLVICQLGYAWFMKTKRGFADVI
jgi:lipopolysaccharide transport system permease protein